MHQHKYAKTYNQLLYVFRVTFKPFHIEGVRDPIGFATEAKLINMIENYMDYSPDACLNIFTNGQINVMRNILEIARPELINESASLSDNEITYFNNNKQLIKTIDVLGRKSMNQKLNLNIDIYQDGSVRKYIQIDK